MSSTSPYRSTLTGKSFLFYEMRTTARLLDAGYTPKQAAQKITAENLYQYPTEKTISRTASTCLRRLELLQSAQLIHALAVQPAAAGRQICLYAMMKHSRLFCDFMRTVIGTKFQSGDFKLRRLDIRAFFFDLREQDSAVASWSEETVKKLCEVFVKALVETEFIESGHSEKLNPVFIEPILAQSMIENGDKMLLPAFNCLSLPEYHDEH